MIRVQQITQTYTISQFKKNVIHISIWLVDGCPERGSSSTPSWPSLNLFTHLITCTYNRAGLPIGSFFVEFCAEFDRPTLFENIFHFRHDVVSRQGCTKSVILMQPMLGADWCLVYCEGESSTPKPTSPNMSQPVEARQQNIFHDFWNIPCRLSIVSNKLQDSYLLSN